MIFEWYQLQKPLSSVIESVFYYKDYSPEHKVERVVPTGHVFLLFEFDGIPRNTYDPISLEPNATFQKVWVSGMHQNHLSISAHPASEMLVVQFKPIGAHSFFKRQIDRLNDRVIPAEELFGDDILELRETLKSASSFNEKFSLIDQWLLQQWNSELSTPEALSEIIEAFKMNPFVKHNEVVKNYPYAHKTLIQHFKKYCGLKPKIIHRIFRFNQLLAIINEKQEINWTDIAYETGFSDQAHFIKEFQNFCGFNPSSYIKNEFHKGQPNFFPITKKEQG